MDLWNFSDDDPGWTAVIKSNFIAALLQRNAI